MSKVQCDQCSLTYSPRLKNLHNERFHGQPTNCTKCGKLFRCQEYMEKHLKRTCLYNEKRIDKKEPPVFKCLYCADQYPLANSCYKHIKNKHKGFPCYLCNFCYQPYGKKIELSKHVSVAHKMEVKYDCPKCELQFKSLNSLASHKQKHKAGVDIETKTKVKNHNRLNRLKCDICDLNFEKEEHLVSHILLTHEIEQSECEICTETFRNIHQLTIHRVKEHEIKNSDLSCKVCDEIFTSGITLVVHQNNAHPDEILNECDICLMTFSTRVEYLVHMNKKHLIIKPDKEYKPRKCKLCNKTFMSSSDYWTHIKTMHGMTKSTSKLKVASNKSLKTTLCFKIYTCSVCKIAYKNSKSLKQHMIHIHNRCYICLQMLQNKTEMFHHYKTHNIKMVLRCFHCKELFKRAQELDEHIVNKHATVKGVLNKKISGSLKIVAKNQKTYNKMKCKRCNYISNSAFDSNSHRDRYHTKKQCHICKKWFVNRIKHDIHNEKVHNVNLNKFECHVCHVTYATISSRNYHIRMIHKTEKIDIKAEKYNVKAEKFNVKAERSDFKAKKSDFKAVKSSSEKTNIKAKKSKIKANKRFRKVDNRNQVKCRLCSKTMKAHGTLEKHIRLFHRITFDKYVEKTTKLNQNSCKKSDDFAEIINVVDGQTQIKCKLCSKIMINANGAIHHHLRQRHGINYNDYIKKLPVVNKYEVERNLDGKSNVVNDAIDAQDVDDQNQIMCKICVKTIESTGLNNHLKSVHEMTYEDYIEKTSKYVDENDVEKNSDVKSVALSAQEVDQNQIMCKICLKIIESTGLNNHLKIVHEMDYEDYIEKTSKDVDVNHVEKYSDVESVALSAQEVDQNQITCTICLKVVKNDNGIFKNHLLCLQIANGMTDQSEDKETSNVVDENGVERNSDVASVELSAQDVNDQNQITCTICLKVLQNKRGGLKNHLRLIHGMRIEEYSSSSSIDEKSVHSEEIASVVGDQTHIQCQLCSKVVRNANGGLHNHVRQFHRMKYEDYVIETSNVIDNNDGGSNIERDAQDVDDENEAVCRICLKVLKNAKTGLKNHIRMAHKMSYEEYTTISVNDIQSQKTDIQVKTEHDDDNLSRIQCKICCKTMINKSGAIHHHLRRIHGMKFEYYVEKILFNADDKIDVEKNSDDESNVERNSESENFDEIPQSIDDQNQIQCKICSKNMVNKSGAIHHHLRRIHGMKFEYYVEKILSNADAEIDVEKNLDDESNVERNAESEDVDEIPQNIDDQNQIQCKICSKTMRNANGAIHHHLRRVHGMKFEDYVVKILSNADDEIDVEGNSDGESNVERNAESGDVDAIPQNIDDQNQIQCKFCSKIVKTSGGAMTHHLKKMHEMTYGEYLEKTFNVKVFKCHKCEFFSSNVRSFKPHIRSHEERINCVKCKQMFTCKLAYYLHLNDKHNQTIRYYDCYICNILTPSLWKLKTHVSAAHGITDTKILKCKICSKRFEDKDEYINHIVSKHKMNMRKYVDRLVNSAVERRKKLSTISEKKSVKSVRKYSYQWKYKYKCNVCHYTTKFHILYVKHMNITHKIFKYTCSVCPIRCKNVGTLRRHFEKQHVFKSKIFAPTRITGNDRECTTEKSLKSNLKENFGSKYEYKCNRCKFTTQSHSSYAKHMNTIHKIFNYTCHLCQNIYQTIWNLRRHFKEKHDVNSGIDPANDIERSAKKSLESDKKENLEVKIEFTCNVCDYSTKYHTLYAKHMNITHKIFKYTCHVCSKTYDSVWSLLRHFKEKHGFVRADLSSIARINSECKECKCKFNSEELVRHIMNWHKPIKCQKCSKMSKDRASYGEHLSKVHKVKIYPCKMCKMKFTHPSSLSKHKKRSHTNNRKYFKIENRKDIAEKSVHVTARNYATRAVVNAGGIDEKPSKLAAGTKFEELAYECKECECKFSYFGFIRHNRHSHTRIQCGKCTEKCKNRADYINHLQNVHKVTVKLYPCTMCKIKYMREHTLLHHIEKNHGNNPETRITEIKKDIDEMHKCDKCDRSYPNEYDLRRHVMQIHKIKTERFDCQKCDSSYKWLQTLRKHMRVFHKEELDFVKIPAEEEKPVNKRICTFCDMEFNSFDSLKDHMFTAHNCKIQLKNDAEKGTFKCFICSKLFGNQSTLKMHLTEVHEIKLPSQSDEKPSLDQSSLLTKSNDCNICGEIIANNLYHHMKHKHGLFNDDIDDIEVIKCQFCLEEFKSGENFNEHLRNIHKTRICNCPTCGRLFLYGDGYTIQSACLSSCKTFKSELVLRRCSATSIPNAEPVEPNVVENDNPLPTIAIDKILSIKEEPLDEHYEEIYSMNYFDNVFVKTEVDIQ